MIYLNNLNRLKNIANSHIFVNQCTTGNVYEEWNSGENRYPAINIAPTSVSVLGDSITLSVTMTYADRLMDNEQNRDVVQDKAIEVLTQIIKKYEEDGYTLDNQYNMVLYTQKFADLLAGAYTKLNINRFIPSYCGDNDYFVEE